MNRYFLLKLCLAAIVPLIAGCFASGPKFSTVAIQKDQAIVFIYRPIYKYIGSSIDLNIKVDGESIGMLSGNGYLQKIIAPGKHEVTCETEVTDKITFTAQPSQAYFVEVTSESGVVVERPKLTLMPEDRGKTAICEMRACKK